MYSAEWTYRRPRAGRDAQCEDASAEVAIKSDVAPLNGLIQAVLEAGLRSS